MQTFFGIHGPAWTGLHGMEHPPYFVEAHYMGFREMEPTYSVYGEPHFSPYDSSSFPVGISGSPSFVHVGEPMYYETLGHLGSLRPPYSIPMHGYPKEASYEDVPQHGPTRSSSSVPSYSAVRSEAREPRPKQQKVAPVRPGSSFLPFKCSPLYRMCFLCSKHLLEQFNFVLSKE